MAKISSKKDLPEWFRLDKYKGVESFKAIQWYEQLSRRRSLLRYYDWSVSSREVPSYELKLWRYHTSKNAIPIRLAPIECDLSYSLAEPEENPVKDVRTIDLMKQMDRDMIAEREGFCDPKVLKRWEVINDPQAYYDACAEVACLPITIDFYDSKVPNRAVIQIDLGATNSVIIEAFKSWLKEARSQLNPSTPKRNKPEYDRWARYCVLPYLDLLIWSMETGNSIKDDLMSSILFPEQPDGIGRLKTTKKNSSELMRDLSELRVLAAVEAAS